MYPALCQRAVELTNLASFPDFTVDELRQATGA
jgi:hypothetical protein